MPGPTVPAAASRPPEPDGLRLRPFRGLHPGATADPAELGARLCPPYDVIDPELRSRLAEQDRHNAVHLILPEGPPADRYLRAARLLDAWRVDGTLIADEGPALYVYEEATPDGHVQRGLVGALELARPDSDIVLPHEDTMAGPVADRLALLAATRADLEAIVLVYEGGGPAGELVADPGTPADLHARTGDGTTHRVWRVADRGRAEAAAADLRGRRAVIGDGHHRYATYLRYQEERWAAGAGPGPWDLGLVLLVDANRFGPRVEAIHRVVPGLAPADAAERAGAAFRVTALSGPIDAAMTRLATAGAEGSAFLVTGGDAGEQWLLTDPAPDQLAAAVPTDRSAAWRALDGTVAHRL